MSRPAERMDAPLDPNRFAEGLGGWLAADGPDHDVVVSCRARLARNVAGRPFVERLGDDEAAGLCEELQAALAGAELTEEAVWVPMEQASALLRLLLRERHLVSRDLAPVEPGRSLRPGRAVVFGGDEAVSAMVNEEDHLRLSALAPGFAVRDAWERARALDLALEDVVEFAHDDDLGYLTGCPTNVGTGLRASVMLHLPALGIARTELEKVFTAAQRTGLAVRGMYGEGSRAAGDFYQISNQVTLGRSEEELLADLDALVPCIVEFERRVRAVLFEEQRRSLEQRLKNSLHLLRTARALSTEVALMHVSNVRLAAQLGLEDGASDEAVAALGRIAIQVQRGHVQALGEEDEGDDLVEPTRRDRLRASLLRRLFAARG